MEEERIPAHGVGIKLSNLTEEIFKDVCGIYDKAVKSLGAHESYRLGGFNRAVKDIREMGAAEFRFGSKLDSDSKLWIRTDSYLPSEDRIIKFVFSANLSPKDRNRLEKDEEELRKKFETEVQNYLISRNLAMPLSR